MTFYCCHHWYIASIHPTRGFLELCHLCQSLEAVAWRNCWSAVPGRSLYSVGSWWRVKTSASSLVKKASESQTPGSWLPFACSAHVLLQDCWSQIFKIQTLTERFLISRHQHSYRPSAKTRMSHPENASLVHSLWVEQLTSGLLESSMPDVSPNP